MQLFFDFLENLNMNGNVTFSFINDKGKYCTYNVSILNKEIRIKYQVVINEGNYCGVSDIYSVLAYLIYFSLGGSDFVKQRKVSFDSKYQYVFEDDVISSITYIYAIMDSMLQVEKDFREEFILTAVKNEEDFISFLENNAKNYDIEVSKLDLKSLELSFRSSFRFFERNFVKGLNLYRDLQNNSQENYQLKQEKWNIYIGKEKKEEDIAPTVKKELSMPEAKKTKIDYLEHIGIGYEFLEEASYPSNPAIGRDKEIEQLCLSLFTLTKSPILVGEAGVGKTAIVEGLGYLIQKGEVPNSLKNKKIMKVSISSLVSGCMYVGMFQKRVESLISYLRENSNIILFLDEVHTAVGAGAGSESDLDLANILKPYLDRGQIKIIGSTTNAEYNEYLSSDAAFRRRFEKINVCEPDKWMLKQIISSYIIKLSTLTNIIYPFDGDMNETIISLLILATENKNRVYHDRRNNPDLVLSILEKAYAYAQYNNELTLSIEHLSRAIEMCDVLYPDNRRRFALKMQSLSRVKKLVRSNIISFPKL